MANVRREINKLLNDLEETVGTKYKQIPCSECDWTTCSWQCPEHPKAISFGQPLSDGHVFDPQTCGTCGRDRVYTFNIGDRDVDADI